MNKEKLLRILSAGIDVGNYYILFLLLNGENLESLWQIQKIRGWREALIRKLLLSEINGEYIVTDKGKEMLAEIEGEVEIKESTVAVNLTFDQFCESLHNNIQSVILENTGKKNYISPSGKPLNSSLVELKERFFKFFKKFGNIEYSLIERAILQYVKDATTGKIKYPIRIIYFIWNMKGDSIISEMMQYIENLDEIEETKKEIIDTKKLF